MGDIMVESSRLKGASVKEQGVPSLIDELPVLLVAACFAKGKTILESIAELRVKETDRIRSMCENLQKMGAKIVIRRRAGREDLIIEGVGKLRGARVRSFGDHRTAMSMVIAGLKAEGVTRIDDVSCIAKSFPGFLSILKPLLR
jgi:3-phosphoshikimate 1-carboxyvinyltransferase